jgi:hypothetical protein
MSLKAFHLIFVTLLTTLSFGCARGHLSAPTAQPCCSAWLAIAAVNPGHHLRNLFFEETEKDELPMKSLRKNPLLAAAAAWRLRAVAAVRLRRVLRQIRFAAGQRHELGHLHPAGRHVDRADVHRAVLRPRHPRREGANRDRKQSAPKNPPNMTEWFANHILGMPELASKNGESVDALIVYVHWLMLALFIGWIIYFGYAVWRFRASRNPKADYHGVRNHASSYIELPSRPSRPCC